jgi:exodeoxyribonuclease-3
MKLITWNCQGAFRRKIDRILLEHPDVLVVQECEHPTKMDTASALQKQSDVLWFGDSEHKGLGIFSFGSYKLELLSQYNEDIKIVIPISVTGKECNFILLAIWANNHNDPDGQYIEQVWKAANYYEKLMGSEKLVLIGDFNSNKIWDKFHRKGSHSAVVEKLAKYNIYSAYHEYFAQAQGSEEHPTFFLQRNEKKPYHIDYCFLSAFFYKKVESVTIGKYSNWIALSDHMPLIINIGL